jgi:hypothetical protein
MFKRVSERAAGFFLYSINRLGLVTETESVYYAVQTEYISPTQINVIL